MLACWIFGSAVIGFSCCGALAQIFKVSVKENEVPTEKNSSREYFRYKGKLYIIITKLPYRRFYFIEFQKALKFFALELRGIEFTAEAPAVSRC